MEMNRLAKLINLKDEPIDKTLILQLSQETGFNVSDCKKALDYVKEHKEDNVTPLGYLKAISLAVNTPTLSFLERVQYYSK